MLTKTATFRGIPSGDGDGLCFDVTKEDFARLTDKRPTKFDKSVRYHGLYRLYPDCLLPEIDPTSEVLRDFEVTVKAERTTEYANPLKAYQVAIVDPKEA